MSKPEPREEGLTPLDTKMTNQDEVVMAIGMAEIVLPSC